MKSVRLFRVAGGQSVLVIELPRRHGLSGARVVVKAATQSKVHSFDSHDPALCDHYVRSFDERSARYAVARLLSQKGDARVQ